MNLTQEQKDICDYDFSKNILIVNAFAGTGKTSTLVEFCKTRSKRENNPSILYLCFNSSIKKEAEQKFKKFLNVTVKTTHGLAFPTFIKHFKNTSRLGNIFVKHITDSEIIKIVKEKKLRSKYARASIDLFRLFCRSEYLSFDKFVEKSYDYLGGKFLDERSYIEIVSLDGIEIAKDKKLDLNTIISLTRGIIYDLDNNPNSSIPVEHDYYLKLYHMSKPVLDKRYQYILVDEAQDLNPVVVNLVLMQQKARLVFVGDAYQQIYSWRGAVNALKNIQASDFPSETKYLTTSFRCPIHVAEKANMFLKLCGEKKDFIGKKVCPNDMVEGKTITYISRSNNAIVEEIMMRLENGQDDKIFVIGGSAGIGLDIYLDIERLLDGNVHQIKDQYLKQFKNFKIYIDHIEDVKDQQKKNEITRVMNIRQRFGTVENLQYKMKSILVNNEFDADVIFTTAHKSKGLEWDNVIIQNDFGTLVEYEHTEDGPEITKVKQGEELNLLYVACTRSKQYLEIPKDLDIDEHILNDALNALNKMRLFTSKV